MQKLQFDTGVKEFEVNGGKILRFNPSDPNVYSRFLETAGRIEGLEQEYIEKTKALQEQTDEKGFPLAGQEVVAMLCELDSRVKSELSFVFGAENNFDYMLDGVNLMAVASNGERVLTNLFTALRPIIEAGAQQHMQAKAGVAVAQAKQNRQQRRERR